MSSSQAETEQRLQESLQQAKQECQGLQNALTALQNASARQFKEASMQADALQRELQAANVCVVWNESESLLMGRFFGVPAVELTGHAGRDSDLKCNEGRISNTAMVGFEVQ